MKFINIILIIIGFILFFISAFILFEPSNGPTGFFVYVPSLAIVNPDNNVPLNSNLEVEFMTKGTNDLAINPSEGDIKFIELKCGDKKVIPALDNEKIMFKDYHCQDDSKVTVKILSTKVILEFKFGNKVQQVQNIAP